MTRVNAAEGVTTVNYHLLKACNMRCGFCHSTFEDALPSPTERQLRKNDASQVVDLLCQHGFSKINFAGGEPTLLPWLSDLIRQAKSHGLVTSIVTNGSRITGDWMDNIEGYLDIIALSIDSINSWTSQSIGRLENGKSPMLIGDYQRIAGDIKRRNIRLKINTVVNQFNYREDLTEFILSLSPERWKVFQVLPVQGQNDQRIGEFAIAAAQFDEYIQRSRVVEAHGVKVVAEDNRLMTGSYIMVDPSGRFFDNTKGQHTYSDPILEVGVAEALKGVTTYPERFDERDGRYN